METAIQLPSAVPQPGLSVVLTTRNRAQSLKKSLQGYLDLDTPPIPWELLIVDNGSSDETSIVAHSLEAPFPVRYVVEARPGQSRARNLGIAHCTYSVVVFTDDDITPSPQWLTAYADVVTTHPEASYFGGPIDLDLSECQLPPWALDASGMLHPGIAYQLSRLDLGETAAQEWRFYGGNMAYRKTLFERFGGFSTQLGHQGNRKLANEETVFQKKVRAAGEMPLYVPPALVWHRITQDEFRIRSRVRHSYWKGQARAIQGLMEDSDTPLKFARTARNLRNALSLMRRIPFSTGYSRVAMLCELAKLAGYEAYMLGGPFGSRQPMRVEE